MDISKEFALLNLSTGEIIEELSANEFYIRKRERVQRKFICSNGKVITPGDDNELVYCRYKNAVVINAQELRELNKELSSNERTIIETLLSYVSYHTNIVTVDNCTRFTTEELARLCSMSDKTFRNAAAKLSREFILISTDGGRGKARQWILNPLIAHKGKYYSIATRELFKKYKVRSKNMEEWGRYNRQKYKM